MAPKAHQLLSSTQERLMAAAKQSAPKGQGVARPAVLQDVNDDDAPLAFRLSGNHAAAKPAQAGAIEPGREKAGDVLAWSEDLLKGLEEEGERLNADIAEMMAKAKWPRPVQTRPPPRAPERSDSDESYRKETTESSEEVQSQDVTDSSDESPDPKEKYVEMFSARACVQ
jgi:hypothetical protein